jgi:hypothetical protein
MDVIHTIHFWTSSMGHLILLVNVIVCWTIRKQLPAFFQWFNLFLLSGLMIQIVAKIYLYRHMNNLPLLHLYTLLEFILLSLFYRKMLQDLKLKYFSHFVGITTVLILLNSLFIQPITSFNSIAKTFTQVTYIGYSLLFFFYLTERGHRLLNLTNSAVLIYYSASLFIFMFTNVLTDLKDLIPYYNYLWVTNAFLYLLFQLIVLYSLWKTGSQQTKSSPWLP